METEKKEELNTESSEVTEELTKNESVPPVDIAQDAQDEPVEDPEKTFEALRMKRIKALQKKISKLKDERDILERKAGDTLGNSGDYVPIVEQMNSKIREIRDCYAEIEKVLNAPMEGGGENELT